MASHQARWRRRSRHGPVDLQTDPGVGTLWVKTRRGPASRAASDNPPDPGPFGVLVPKASSAGRLLQRRARVAGGGGVWAPGLRLYGLLECVVIASAAVAAAVVSTEAQWRRHDLLVALLLAGLVGERLKPERAFVAPPVGYVLAFALVGPSPAFAIAGLTTAITAIVERDKDQWLDRMAAVSLLTAMSVLLLGDVVGHPHIRSGVHRASLSFVTIIFATCLASYATTALCRRAREHLSPGASLGSLPTGGGLRFGRAVVVSSALVSGIGLAYTAHDRTITDVTTLIFAAVLVQTLVSETRRARARAADLELEKSLHAGYPQQVRDVVSSRCSKALQDDVVNELVRLRATLAAGLSGDQPQALYAVVGHGLEVIRAEVEGLRQLIHELRPAVLDPFGLTAALEALVIRTANREDLEARLVVNPPGAAPALTSAEALAAYRLVEEAVRNVVDHADARHLTITVNTARRVSIAVVDDGCGFCPAAVRSGFGLSTMRERAQMIDAVVHLDASPGKGTRVRIDMDPRERTSTRTRRLRSLGAAIGQRARIGHRIGPYPTLQLAMIAFACSLAVLTAHRTSWQPFAVFELLVLLSIIARSCEVRLQRFRYSAVTVPVTSAAILLGIAPAMVCALTAALSDGAQQRISPALALARLYGLSVMLLVAAAGSALVAHGGALHVGDAGHVLALLLVLVLTLSLGVALAIIHANLTTTSGTDLLPVPPAPLAPVLGAVMVIATAAVLSTLNLHGGIAVLALGLVASQRISGASFTSGADARALVSARRDRLRRGVDAQEAECARWARELHDELQGLAIVQQQVGRTIRDSDQSKLRRAAQSMCVEIEAALEGLGDIVDELHPGPPTRLGLSASLRQLARRVGRRDGLEVCLDVPRPIEPEPDGEVALSIYRLVQEALANAVRHGGASRADVEIRQGAVELSVNVSDDGTGFRPGRPARGLGLAGMRERAQLIGADLTITSRPGAGANIRLRVPCSPG
jgi:two-component system sensor histidine kinase UhpB